MSVTTRESGRERGSDLMSVGVCWGGVWMCAHKHVDCVYILHILSYECDSESKSKRGELCVYARGHKSTAARWLCVYNRQTCL